jgi:hypothetical protein
MIGHLGFEGSFQNGFGQLFQQNVLPDDIRGFLGTPSAVDRLASC